MKQESDEKLIEIFNEYKALETRLQDPNTLTNSKLLQEISVRHAEIADIAKTIEKLLDLKNQLKENQILLEAEPDSDMQKYIQDEIKNLEESIITTRADIKKAMKLNDPNDKRDAILEIRAGTGGEEAALFAADLFRMYSKYAESQGFEVKILSANYTGNGGFKEVIVSIEGKNVYGKLKYESGVHRVQRIPATESSGRIHTSAASVVVLPQIDDNIDIQIKDEDIQTDTYRATGPGGQSVNTTDSAVRITHKPTGIVVTCQDGKSQHKNKEKALSILKSKLFQMEQEKQAGKTDSKRKSAIKGGDRSVKIKTYNFPQGRITDHRIKQTWHNLTGALDGNIDEILSETAQKLSDENDI